MELLIIQKKIYEIRGERVMLDFHLAELYGVETRVLVQAVKRNLRRFPLRYMPFFFALINKSYLVVNSSNETFTLNSFEFVFS